MTCSLIYLNTITRTIICQECADAEELRERFSHNLERGVQVPSSGLAQNI